MGSEPPRLSLAARRLGLGAAPSAMFSAALPPLARPPQRLGLRGRPPERYGERGETPGAGELGEPGTCTEMSALLLLPRRAPPSSRGWGWGRSVRRRRGAPSTLTIH